MIAAEPVPAVEIVRVHVTSWSYGRFDVPRTVDVVVSWGNGPHLTSWDLYAHNGEVDPSSNDDMPPGTYRHVRERLVEEWHQAAAGDRSWWMK